MKIVRMIIIILVVIASTALAAFFIIGFIRQKPAGILIESVPASSVYLNDNFVGKTPFKGQHEVGEVSLKLVPENSTQSAFLTKITLVSGIQTVVRREFGVSEDTSSGDVISFDRPGGNEAAIVIISTPDNAQVSIDGIPQAFTPYKSLGITSGSHQITIRAPGYADRTIAIKTISGLRLTLFAKLAKIPEISKEASNPTPKIFVQILTTPTGFLRVRTRPGAGGEEIAQVKPGSTYPFISEDTATGWLEIQYEATQAGLPNGITGWVSGEFSKKIEIAGDATSSGKPN